MLIKLFNPFLDLDECVDVEYGNATCLAQNATCVNILNGFTCDCLDPTTYLEGEDNDTLCTKGEMHKNIFETAV